MLYDNNMVSFFAMLLLFEEKKMTIKAIFIGTLIAGLGMYTINLLRMGVVKAQGCQMIPREILFGNTDKKIQARISPQGTYLTYLAPVNTVMNIWIRHIDAADDKPITNDTNRGIQNYWWSYAGDRLFYIQDTAGDENWRLYSVSIADGKVTEYTPFDNVQVRLIEYSKENPDRMLIGMNKRDPKMHDVFELNVKTGVITPVIENPGKVVGWIANEDLVVLGRIETLADGGYQLFVRDSSGVPWHLLATWTKDDETPGDMHLSKDSKYLYTTDGRKFPTSRFVKISFDSGDVTVLASDPEYDINGSALIDIDSLEPLAISYSRERKAWIFFDEPTEKAFKEVRSLDHGDISIVSRTLDNKKWVVSFMKDNGPLSFWLFDRVTKKKTFLFDHQPILKQYTLSSMNPISFHARDGLLIHGYITYPCDALTDEQRKNLPLVLDVHGGPWVRDVWGFDTEAQWLANRGYAVLQVNYRGSKGYGKEFVNAGNKQWGIGFMQHDLTDAVHWAINQGIADSKKVAIYGGSYGGYAALAGATFTPDLYCCAVDIVGISNLTTWIKTAPPYWASFIGLVHNRVGNPDTEQEFMKSISPFFHVDAIKIPILIAQGANDPRVKQAESEQIVAAMKEKGLDYEYLLFPDEGHGFVKPQNKLKFYKAAEKFLAKHLGGRYEE